MPKPGDAITEAELTELYVEDGAHVSEGDPLYQIATDKVEMDIEAPATGVVAWKVNAGDTYNVGELLAMIEDR
jgi:pyruvate/2-oxoglutarate dehydrogenase complex dihydrolipoamide acyltransferase (E2) component